MVVPGAGGPECHETIKRAEWMFLFESADRGMERVQSSQVGCNQRWRVSYFLGALKRKVLPS